MDKKKVDNYRLERINQTLLGMKESILGAEFLTEVVPESIKKSIKNLEKEREEIKARLATQQVDAYATKYKECRLCGTEADCVYISQEDGLCQSCRSNEEYY